MFAFIRIPTLTAMGMVGGIAGPVMAQAPPPDAQSVLHVLDAMPAHTQGFIYFQNPMIAQIKLQGVASRMGEPNEDLLTALEKRFGLGSLPNNHRGLALAILSDESVAGGVSEVLFVPVSGFKPLMETLKAVSPDGKQYTYKANGKTFLAAEKAGWALLAESKDVKAFKLALKPGQGVRSELGGWDSWLGGGEVSGMLTPRGLLAISHLYQKEMRETRSKSMSKQGQVDAYVEPIETFLAQAEREVTHVAFRAEMDEDGNLSLAAKVRLTPSGRWAGLGNQIRKVDAYGLEGLPGGPYVAAGGGNLPSEWSRQLGNLGIDAMNALLISHGVSEAESVAVKAAMNRNIEHIKGLSFLMPADKLSPRPPVMRFRVDDVQSYRDDLEKLVVSMNELAATKSAKAISTLRKGRVGGFPAISVSHDFSSMTTKVDEDLDDETPSKAPLLQSYVFLDGQSLVSGPLPLEQMEALLPVGAGSNPISEDEGIRKSQSFLPKDGSLYLFVNPKSILEMQDQGMDHMKEMLPEDLKARWPVSPEIPDGLPLALALTFAPDTWSLDVIFPATAQVLLGGQQKKSTEIRNARTKLMQEYFKRQEDSKRQEGKDGPATRH